MVRLSSVALMMIILPAAAWAGSPALAEPAKPPRSFALPSSSTHYRFAPDGSFGRAEIAPNAQFGVGMFGMKIEKSPLQPVIGREIIAPKQRRAGVGFSLRF